VLLDEGLSVSGALSPVPSGVDRRIQHRAAEDTEGHRDVKKRGSRGLWTRAVYRLALARMWAAHLL
jgi:hypothetical protein